MRYPATSIIGAPQEYLFLFLALNQALNGLPLQKPDKFAAREGGGSGRQGLSCVCDGVNILRKLPIFPVNVKLAQFADCHFEGSEPSRP